MRSNAAVLAAMLALFAVACGGSEEDSPKLYSEPCIGDPECAEGLECFEAIGICSQGCLTMTECRTNLGSPDAVCVGGVCQQPCTPTDFSACDFGLMCVQSSAGSTCRGK